MVFLRIGYCIDHIIIIIIYIRHYYFDSYMFLYVWVKQETYTAKRLKYENDGYKDIFFYLLQNEIILADGWK